ncbi:MAG: indole-3-glycerol-phosphate synthase TrpC, partial [Bacteroidales bacterium]|nr:indole-3-glycerol-phosphate synthase TrpC [Bacteroidales bacterium]
MATILDEIVENKKREVLELKKTLTKQELKEKPLFSRQTFSLKNALLNSSTGIIAEFKRKSPSKGDIHQGIEPKDVVPLYEKY